MGKQAAGEVVKKGRVKKSPRKKSDRSWTTEELQLLVGYISKHDCLFYPSSRDYMNSMMRADARTKIASEFTNCGNSFISMYYYVYIIGIFESLDQNDVQMKWDSLRARYIRERKAWKKKYPSGTGADEIPKCDGWPLFKSMTFLDPTVKER